MAVNRKKIIEDLSKIEILGNENGLIEKFNVYVNQLPIHFWNGFAERLTNKIAPDLLEATEYLLIHAGQNCGYHTGYGIIKSEEWEAVVAPMIETKEDILHGAFAVLTAWGWGNAEIVELLPNEKMVVRVYNYYESDIVKYGKTDKMSAYMLRGICAAFFSLAYGGEYSPNGDNALKYNCLQTKGIECGDEYGEFIVTPN